MERDVTTGGAIRHEPSTDRPARESVRVASDALIALVAALAAAALSVGLVPLQTQTVLSIVVTASLIVLALVITGNYRHQGAQLQEAALRLAAACALAAGALALFSLVANANVFAPQVSVTAASLAFPMLLFARLWNRVRRRSVKAPGASRTIVVGARDAARAVIRLLDQRESLPFDVVGCVDDDVATRSVEGVPVLGKPADLGALIDAHSIETIIVAATSARRRLVKIVMAACANAGGRRPAVKVLPHLDQLLTGRVEYSPVRDVRLEDLLQRDPVEVDPSRVAPHLENRVVLVTGAGGSIGSELCRQISRFNPKLLVLVGHGENSLVAIDQELRTELGFTKTEVALADVADGFRVRSIFSQYRPHIVFHAAAHKHVPILESNVCEAVRNNVFGTHAVALAAAAAGVAKFVMISTDKAVNPTSVMGATKRVAELICQSFERRTGTEFVSVRFGNVLGSRGSVIDVFKKQIEMGGPLTVTHPDMVRYFMTIPEAVALVLDATAIGRDGQVCVLDMGKPVSVVELAENLVRLCGLRPYDDVDIVFTGIRPGEKLREEILTSHELDNPDEHPSDDPTAHERLFVAQQERVVYEKLVGILTDLEVAVRTPDAQTVIATLRRLVPSFVPGDHLRGDDAESATHVTPLDAAGPLAPPPGEADTIGEAPEQAPVQAQRANVVSLEEALAARSAGIDASDQAEVGRP
ncbi:MAG TPA: nucleoside-diphosphate sugar epimerase/dehydratase [Candidatus Eremiobacteraceae bacterium]|nr:nucleoside-diphosphate sugar epimerase/dehydratase [Candidatus Eremiobacteraceae bacterium]